jgi:putative oxidoreductase
MEQSQGKKSLLNIVLWTLQILMAVAYINAGYVKAFRPIAEIAPTIFWAPALPELLVRFIGISELLGALGLILPAALKIRPQLTTLAAAALSLVMLLANIYHITKGEFFVLPMTMAFLFILLFIAYGRWKRSPIISRKSSRTSNVQDLQ